MFEKLMDEVTKERDRLINKITIELLDKVGIKCSETPSYSELLMIENELKKSNCKLKIEDKDSSMVVGLYKIEDLYEQIEFGYSIGIKSDGNSVQIIATPI